MSANDLSRLAEDVAAAFRECNSRRATEARIAETLRELEERPLRPGDYLLLSSGIRIQLIAEKSDDFGKGCEMLYMDRYGWLGQVTKRFHPLMEEAIRGGATIQRAERGEG